MFVIFGDQPDLYPLPDSLSKRRQRGHTHTVFWMLNVTTAGRMAWRTRGATVANAMNNKRVRRHGGMRDKPNEFASVTKARVAAYVRVQLQSACACARKATRRLCDTVYINHINHIGQLGKEVRDGEERKGGGYEKSAYMKQQQQQQLYSTVPIHVTFILV